MTNFRVFGEVQESKMVGQDGRRSKMMKQFPSHMKASNHFSGIIGNTFESTCTIIGCKNRKSTVIGAFQSVYCSGRPFVNAYCLFVCFDVVDKSFGR